MGKFCSWGLPKGSGPRNGKREKGRIQIALDPDCYLLTQKGIGQSTVISIGGDAILGSTFPDLLPHFEKDEETKCVALFGEIGTTQEERVAEMILKKEFNKPIIAFIAGLSAKEGVRFSHSGAIISGKKGSAKVKKERLEEAGAIVLNQITEFPGVISKVLEQFSVKIL